MEHKLKEIEIDVFIVKMLKKEELKDAHLASMKMIQLFAKNVKMALFYLKIIKLV